MRFERDDSIDIEDQGSRSATRDIPEAEIRPDSDTPDKNPEDTSSQVQFILSGLLKVRGLALEALIVLAKYILIFLAFFLAPFRESLLERAKSLQWNRRGSTKNRYHEI